MLPVYSYFFKIFLPDDGSDEPKHVGTVLYSIKVLSGGILCISVTRSEHWLGQLCR